jgi:hypothetical protein
MATTARTIEIDPLIFSAFAPQSVRSCAQLLDRFPLARQEGDGIRRGEDTLPREGVVEFATVGAKRIQNALSIEDLSLLEGLAEQHRDMGAGIRLFGDPALAQVLKPGGTMDRLARDRLGNEAIPVRAILFDKRPGANWALGWHQDRTIAVRAQREVPGFGPWSRKARVVHVEPPFHYIERMVTLRAHLDDCGADNGALLIVRASHKLGRIPVKGVERAVSCGEQFVCTARAGDVWVYASSILHASDAATNPTHRRVLHVDFSADALPGGLEWYGIG